MAVQIAKGTRVSCTVERVTQYGAWVSVEGTGDQGLILIPDISWGRTQRVADHVSEGERLLAVVIHHAVDRGRIHLGLKQLTPDPWSIHEDALTVGAVHPARVVAVMDYGAIVEVFEHVEALVHVEHLKGLPGFRTHPSDVVAVGSLLTVRLDSVERSERRITASLPSTVSPTPP